MEKADVLEFLKFNSRFYPTVQDVSKIAQGGEAIVYRVEHGELDEIVAKCTIFDSTTPEI